jgi:GTP-binding protein HflX
LQLDAIPRLLVFNKMDLVEPEELKNRQRVYNAIPVSAIDRSTLGTLVNEISQRLADDATIEAM